MTTMLPRLVVCACVALLPCAIGSTAPVRDAVIASILVAVMVAYAVQRRSISFSPNPLALAVLTALAACILQCIPLPPGIVQWLSPGAGEIYAVTRPDAARLTLSLDVPTTAHWIVKLLALYAAAVLAPAAFSSREERRWLSAAVALGGVIYVLVSLVDGDALNGSEPLRGPLTNPNHAATSLGLACFCAVAGWIRDDEPRWPMYAIAASVCGAGVFMTLSRGGAILFAVCVACVMAVWWRASSKPPLVGAVLAAVAVGLSIGAHWVYTTETLARPRVVDKTALWPVVAGMIPDFPWLGVGRGAFTTVFTRYTIFPFDLTFTHVENEYLQAIVDFGAPLALVMMGLLSWHVIRLVRAARRRSTIVLLIGLAYVALRDVADFGATRLAIAIPCVLMMSALASSKREFLRRRWSHVVPAVLVVVVSLVVAIVHAVSHELARDTQRVSLLPPEARADAQAIIARHPADFVTRAVRVERSLNAHVLDRELWRDLNATLFLAPMHATPHRLAGRALYLSGHHEQALGEYRAALNRDGSKAPQVISELERLDASLDEIADLALEPEARESTALYFLRRNETKRAALALGDMTDEASIVAIEIAGRAALAEGQTERALRLAGVLQKRAASYYAGYELEVLTLTKLGELQRADDALKRGFERAPTSRELARLAFDRAMAAGMTDEARSIARAYLSRASSAADMAQAHLWTALSHQRDGSLLRALRELERARELSPNDGMVRVALVRVLCGTADVSGARRELEAARRILGSSPELGSLEALVAAAASPR